MFSKTAEYALRAVCLIAREAEITWKTEDIAESTQIPRDYLRKILKSLQGAHILELRRGGGGGVVLARSRSDILVYDVVNAVDPIRRYAGCPLGLVEHGIELCPMHSVLDDALARLEEVMQATSIEDLLHPQLRKRARCQFPIRFNH